MRRLIAALAALAIFCSPAAAAGVPANPIFQTETLLAPPTWSSLTLHGEICNSSAGVMSSSATGCPGVVQSVANGGTGQSAAGAAAANAIGAAAIANNLSDMASLSAARANLIPANSLTLAQFPTLAALTVIGSVGGGTPAALTQTQLTAFINPATASLSGALPAWPNTTTTYFRGDATYQPLNFAAIGGVAAAAQLPTPTASTLGGGESIAQVAHQVVQYLDTSGVHHLVQLAFADLTGSIVSAQCPNATVSATGCVQPDGTTITISGGGVISAVGGGGSSGTPWVAYGATSVTGSTTSTNPTPSANGMTGNGAIEVTSLPYTVPTGHYLILQCYGATSVNGAGTVVMLPWIGSGPASNANSLASAGTTSGTGQLCGAWNIPAGTIVNFDLLNGQATETVFWSAFGTYH